MFELIGSCFSDTARSDIVSELNTIVANDSGFVVLFQCIEWLREHSVDLFPSRAARSAQTTQPDVPIEAPIAIEAEPLHPFETIQVHLVDVPTITHGENIVDRKSVFQVC